jgi:hypothetical protein
MEKVFAPLFYNPWYEGLSIWGYIDEKGGWASKCREYWLSYMRGVQSAHSLRCWKIGTPYSALRDPVRAIEVLSSIVRARIGWDMKYTRDPGLLRIFTRGVIIIYTQSRRDMFDFLGLAIRTLGDFLRRPGAIDDLFYRLLVNTERIAGSFYYRRGCPEYDSRFGDWRRWPL